LRVTIRCLLLLALVAAAAAVFAGTSRTAAPPRPHLPAAAQAPDFTPMIHRLRRNTWRLQVLMGKRRSRAATDNPIERLAFWRQTALGVL